MTAVVFQDVPASIVPAVAVADTQGLILTDDIASQYAAYQLQSTFGRVLAEVETDPSLAVVTEPQLSALFSAPAALYSHPDWPINYHTASSFSSYDRTLTLEDGSIWELSSTLPVWGWEINDPILIRPNILYPFFSNNRYVIENQITGSRINADLTSVGPNLYGASSHWISFIDSYNSRIYLENGSCWQMSWFDSQTLSTWQPGDHIIIGNNGYYSDSPLYDSLIINYNTDESLSAYEI